MSEPATAPTMGSSRWLAVGLHGVFIALVAVSVSRVETIEALLAGLVIGGWYFVGVFARSRRDAGLGTVWLVVLTLLWAAASFFVAVDFVWLAFPLFFLYLFLLPIRIGLLSLIGVTAVAIGALATDGELEIGEVVGPIVGAAVAAMSAISYRALSEEHQRTQRLLAELEETRELLVDAERERGALEERRRLAREVHDTIAQGLSSIILLSRAAELSPSDEPDRIRQIGEIAQVNLDEARRIVAALSPLELDSDSLPDVLEGLVRNVSDTAGIDVTFRTVGEPVRLPLEQEVALLRITQGALANVAAHSGAETAEVTLRYSADATMLDIADDGEGFDPSLLTRSSESGYGLSVMEDRIREVDGTLVVETDPGVGTVITVTIPRRQT